MLSCDRLLCHLGYNTIVVENLSPKTTPGCSVEQLTAEHWRLSLPAGLPGSYRLAQLDDYSKLPRRNFPWRAPLNIKLKARASAPDLPGTWGFGLWNDPFSLSFGFGGGERRFPVLPNAAWFFFASEHNHLSFYDEQPGHGQLAAVFCSPAFPSWLLMPGLGLFPLLFLHAIARMLRRLARIFIRQHAVRSSLDPTIWHQYEISWQKDNLVFSLDGNILSKTELSPHGPLGLVLWCDNQYAALTPEGVFRYGTLANDDSWIEIKELQVISYPSSS